MPVGEMGAKAPLFLAGRGLSKSYGAVKALSDTDFHLATGEVVGLIGHNGAGKSTLINVLAGVVARSGGIFEVLGRDAGDWSANLARENGLRCVFQELSLCPNLSATENTRLLHPALKGFGWKQRARKTIQSALDTVFPDSGIDVDRPVGELSLGERQMIEIARGFSVTDSPVRAIILDEPTSSLGAEATRQFLEQVSRASEDGISVILVTHRLGEILAVAHRVVTMKDGLVISDQFNDGLSRSELVAVMGDLEPETRERRDAVVRDVPVFSHSSGLGDHDIELHQGEIVGLAGLDGHGQRERLRAVFDAARVSGLPVAFVAGDRVSEGLFPLWSIRDNLTIRSLSALSRGGLVSNEAADRLTQSWFERLKVRAPGIATPLLSLSGGNQQKVLFARALASDARLIVLDDPMRGVDVGTKHEVYALIRNEAETGRSFLWYSTETEEFENCDRLHVFREGRSETILDGERIEPNAILEASFGGLYV
ncbi:ATP-binding cassette domain-containing protein [Breoghania corrubedonensis]|nr:sugar ABC transporter ATP-binding protein [Breoghania corrubedonensis]